MGTMLLESPAVALLAPPLRILLLERSETDAEQILGTLRKAEMEITSTVVASRTEFESAIRSKEFDAILSDYALQDWNGVDALHQVRELGLDTPFLLVTGEIKQDGAKLIRMEFDELVFRDRLIGLPLALKHAIEKKKLRASNSHARLALAASEARATDLMEHCVYGIGRFCKDGTILAANPALLALLACSTLADLQTRNLTSDIFRFPEQCLQLLAACRKNGLVHNAEAEWRRKDGGFISVRLHLRFLALANGEEVIEGVVEDVTEIRALELQLRQSQKFETIGQLAGGIAHDFNNVVGAMLGWAEIGYEKSHSHPQLADYFMHIRQQADRAAALTRELLTFARRQALHPRPVDLNSIVVHLSSLLDKVIGKEIEIKVVEGELEAIKADPAQIEQVLMNLSLNARDAMEGGGRLTIETSLVELDDSYCRFYPHVEAGCYVMLSVSDTGCGMSPEVRERIFEPFYTTKDPGRGTGMGLAVVYGIVKQHGGFLHVYSEPGQGSLFQVYFPVMEKSVLASSSSLEVVQHKSLRGSETILLAEDHDSIREMVRQSLVHLGYKVLSAADGEQALKFCDTETPQLAILDVVMPRLGGAATAIGLKEKFPKLPILFTSGYSENGGTAIGEIHASRYLQKPYSPVSLGRVIREILDSEAPAK